MKIILFYHSLLSDWNHGNAHFLRGFATELILRGNDVHIYEPEDSWSYNNLIKDTGNKYINEFEKYYPLLSSTRYKEDEFNFSDILKDADLVIVHEWNTHSLVKKISDYKKHHKHFKLLFHDTHHRALSEPDKMNKYDLSGYDGVLAFGKVIKDIYVKRGFKAFVWHEAADTNIFKPITSEKTGDIVWIGNWGDEERTNEIFNYFIEPVQRLKLKAAVYGVRYPDEAIKKLNDTGIEYKGYIPNFMVPQVFSQYRLTVHIPRRPYVEHLHGIPTIRPFEALACGIPLISKYWNDVEHLFTNNEFIYANSNEQMGESITKVLNNDSLRNELIKNGLSTIREKHNCVVRVDELLSIYDSLKIKSKIIV